MGYHPDYACLVCGEEMPQISGAIMRRGGHYTSDYEQSTKFYDTSKDCYFVRFEEPENLKERYKNKIEERYLLEKKKLNEEIEHVSNEEFRTILKNKIPKRVDENIEWSLRSFDEFVDFFREEFQTGVPQSRYSITSSCFKAVLKNVKRLGKAKYIIDGGNEKILRLLAKLDENKFTKTFPCLSKNFGLDFLNDSNASMTLEFAHFSEFPLDPKYMR